MSIWSLSSFNASETGRQKTWVVNQHGVPRRNPQHPAFLRHLDGSVELHVPRYLLRRTRQLAQSFAHGNLHQ